MQSTVKKGLRKEHTLHFVEVKFRSNSQFGSGLEYITPQKLRQMTFAAEQWLNENNWPSAWQIDAIAVSGQPNDYEFDLVTNITM